MGAAFCQAQATAAGLEEQVADLQSRQKALLVEMAAGEDTAGCKSVAPVAVPAAVLETQLQDFLVGYELADTGHSVVEMAGALVHRLKAVLAPGTIDGVPAGGAPPASSSSVPAGTQPPGKRGRTGGLGHVPAQTHPAYAGPRVYAADYGGFAGDAAEALDAIMALSDPGDDYDDP